MRLAFVVIKNNAGRSVQLRHDDTLGTINDKGTIFGHQRDLSQIYLLLSDILDRLIRRLFVINNQTNSDP